MIKMAGTIKNKDGWRIIATILIVSLILITTAGSTLASGEETLSAVKMSIDNELVEVIKALYILEQKEKVGLMNMESLKLFREANLTGYTDDVSGFIDFLNDKVGGYTSAFTLEKTGVNITEGEKALVKIKDRPYGADSYEVEVISGDEKAASINVTDNKIEVDGLKEGTVTFRIRAKHNGKEIGTATLRVKVNKKKSITGFLFNWKSWLLLTIILVISLYMHARKGYKSLTNKSRLSHSFMGVGLFMGLIGLGVPGLALIIIGLLYHLLDRFNAKVRKLMKETKKKLDKLWEEERKNIEELIKCVKKIYNEKIALKIKPKKEFLDKINELIDNIPDNPFKDAKEELSGALNELSIEAKKEDEFEIGTLIESMRKIKGIVSSIKDALDEEDRKIRAAGEEDNALTNEIELANGIITKSGDYIRKWEDKKDEINNAVKNIIKSTLPYHRIAFIAALIRNNKENIDLDELVKQAGAALNEITRIIGTDKETIRSIKQSIEDAEIELTPPPHKLLKGLEECRDKLKNLIATANKIMKVKEENLKEYEELSREWKEETRKGLKGVLAKIRKWIPTKLYKEEFEENNFFNRVKELAFSPRILEDDDLNSLLRSLETELRREELEMREGGGATPTTSGEAIPTTVTGGGASGGTSEKNEESKIIKEEEDMVQSVKKSIENQQKMGTDVERGEIGTAEEDTEKQTELLGDIRDILKKLIKQEGDKVAGLSEKDRKVIGNNMISPSLDLLKKTVEDIKNKEVLDLVDIEKVRLFGERVIRRKKDNKEEVINGLNNLLQGRKVVIKGEEYSIEGADYKGKIIIKDIDKIINAVENAFYNNEVKEKTADILKYTKQFETREKFKKGIEGLKNEVDAEGKKILRKVLDALKLLPEGKVNKRYLKMAMIIVMYS